MNRPPISFLAAGCREHGGPDIRQSFLAARSAQRKADPIHRAATAQGIPVRASRLTVRLSSAPAFRSGVDTGVAAGAAGVPPGSSVSRTYGRQDPASGGTATGCVGLAVLPTRKAAPILNLNRCLSPPILSPSRSFTFSSFSSLRTSALSASPR